MHLTRALLVLLAAAACTRNTETTSSSPPAQAPRPAPPVVVADAAVPVDAIVRDATVPDAAILDAGVSTTRLAPPAVSKARGCIVDLNAESACHARGAGFTYGPTPFIYCSGVAADTRALAQQHAEMQRKQPCSCLDQRAIEQQQERCSMVP